MRLGVLLCLAASLVLSTPALAGDDEQVALTPQMVEKFVEGHADLEALVLTVVVEQVAELLGIDPERVDPRYEGE